MTDLQRIQGSARRFGFNEAIEPPTTGADGGIVLTIACCIDLGDGNNLADQIVAGIWQGHPTARTRLVFDADGRMLADRSIIQARRSRPSVSQKAESGMTPTPIDGSRNREVAP